MMRSLRQLDQYKHEGFTVGYPIDLRVFYSPLDDVAGALHAVALEASRSLTIAMFELTDSVLADILLVKAQNPQITVQISLDASQAVQSAPEVQLLAREKFPKTSIAFGHSEKNAYMHLKELVVDGRDTIHGSTNATLSGETKQDNELLVIRNEWVAEEANTRLNLIHQYFLGQVQP